MGRTEIRVGGPAISKRELIYMLLSKGGRNWQRLFLCEDFVFSRNQGKMQSGNNGFRMITKNFSYQNSIVLCFELIFLEL